MIDFESGIIGIAQRQAFATMLGGFVDREISARIAGGLSLRMDLHHHNSSLTAG